MSDSATASPSSPMSPVFTFYDTLVWEYSPSRPAHVFDGDWKGFRNFDDSVRLTALPLCPFSGPPPRASVHSATGRLVLSVPLRQTDSSPLIRFPLTSSPRPHLSGHTRRGSDRPQLVPCAGAHRCEITLPILSLFLLPDSLGIRPCIS